MNLQVATNKNEHNFANISKDSNQKYKPREHVDSTNKITAPQ